MQSLFSSRKTVELSKKVLSFAKIKLPKLLYLTCLIILNPCWFLVKLSYQNFIEKTFLNTLDIIDLVLLIVIKLKSGGNCEMQNKSNSSWNSNEFTRETINLNENNNNARVVEFSDVMRTKFKPHLKKYILNKQLNSNQTFANFMSDYYSKKRVLILERKNLIKKTKKEEKILEKFSNTTFVIESSSMKTPYPTYPNRKSFFNLHRKYSATRHSKLSLNYSK